MSGEQQCSGAAGKPREKEEEKKKKKKEVEEEDFYDCQETLEPPDPREEEEEEEEEEEPENCHQITERLTVRGDITETDTGGGHRQDEQGDRLHGDGLQGKQGDRLQEKQGNGLQDDRLQDDGLQDNGPQEEQDDRLQDDGLQECDSDSEMKEEQSQMEFDDEYLREAEKELTEEEKEVTCSHLCPSQSGHMTRGEQRNLRGRRQQSLSLKEKGNREFKDGDWAAAASTYTEALVLCPVCFSRERSVLFSNRAAARLHLDLKEQAISDCTRAIELNPDYVRALLRRAELYEQTEKLDEALEDYKMVLERDPNQTGARLACMKLPQQIQERNEKLKEEMLGKLKDLGNMILRPFGLSTNNFQVNQDQGSGSYSINFVQKPSDNR
ncbi:putative tetratricopeptide repeat protein 1 [Scophthalmus maximus]|uniref:Tetratricopeptide repeat protein 1 n=1 Tax=Scophthalmus maximus TaxID=52904 RepID=A0A2U9B770_SCOMX|nr:putative tetratricopeptide repeat protein 1 [Scophthalmus maximus]